MSLFVMVYFFAYSFAGEHPAWIERAAYEQSDYIYVVGVGYGKDERSARAEAVSSARKELAIFTGLDPIVIPIESQMIYKVGQPGGLTIYRLMRANKAVIAKAQSVYFLECVNVCDMPVKLTMNPTMGSELLLSLAEINYSDIKDYARCLKRTALYCHIHGKDDNK